ncbi:nucleotidyltransferase family protein [Pusillimonas sp. SM2304]|uniref:nucleotidyltransferase family protein n=1 Tax=Pusillimonas sp. SM2304 TaxID=3073241 RepID=UPI0028740ECB|nr:nucleotidyltransferase family protein [Pusillimonas sp. SM2304]MDS1138911.1 nucleotidyltransferase family protein [Pusillimonas sp. SM2304]
MMISFQTHYEQQLCGLVESSAQLMAALRAVHSLGLSSWCIGAGAIRSLVWDTLHGFQEPSYVEDVDVAYFDADAPIDQDSKLQERLHKALPTLSWEVTNQAHVHRWFADTLGQVVSPLVSLEDGLATWPEYATCVGIYLDDDEALQVIAPYGLDDLFGLRVRHNPRRASVSTFMHRVKSKKFAERWPRLLICH